MRKKLMMAGLALCVLCSATACGKKTKGTVQEGLPEDVQKIVDTMDLDKLVSTEQNEAEK